MITAPVFLKGNEAVVHGALLRDPTVAAEMGTRSRDAVIARFNLQGRVAETLQVYQEVLGHPVLGAGGGPTSPAAEPLEAGHGVGAG